MFGMWGCNARRATACMRKHSRSVGPRREAPAGSRGHKGQTRQCAKFWTGPGRESSHKSKCSRPATHGVQHRQPSGLMQCSTVRYSRTLEVHGRLHVHKRQGHKLRDAARALLQEQRRVGSRTTYTNCTQHCNCRGLSARRRHLRAGRQRLPARAQQASPAGCAAWPGGAPSAPGSRSGQT